MTEDEKKNSSKYQNWLNALRWAINTLVIFLVIVTILLGVGRYLNGGIPMFHDQGDMAIPIEPTSTVESVKFDTQIGLPAFKVQSSLAPTSLNRVALLDTEIPVRPRVDVITYTVQQGDSIFSIADDFGLKAETVLWGNYDTLKDNPHLLKTGQEINILPVNAVSYTHLRAHET